MRIPGMNYYLIGLSMIVVTGLTIIAKPKLPATRQPIQLAAMIPAQFGDWKEETELTPIMVDPAVEKLLDKIYNQTLTRTYSDSKGDRIMLSIAYGGNQSDGLQVHKPEVCYSTRGFQIINLIKTMLPLSSQQSIPVKRMIATQGVRVEPITYWMIVGDEVEVDSLKWKLAQLRYGLTGVIPDGLLFRVSSIGTDSQYAFTLQDKFVHDLLSGVDKNTRIHLVGMPRSRGNGFE